MNDQNVSGNKNELKLNEYRNFDIKKCVLIQLTFSRRDITYLE